MATNKEVQAVLTRVAKLVDKDLIIYGGDGFYVAEVVNEDGGIRKLSSATTKNELLRSLYFVEKLLES